MVTWPGETLTRSARSAIGTGSSDPSKYTESLKSRSTFTGIIHASNVPSSWPSRAARHPTASMNLRGSAALRISCACIKPAASIKRVTLRIFPSSQFRAVLSYVGIMPLVKLPKTAAERAARVKKILQGLDKMYPGVTCALSHQTPWELLVATILSAQCTDKRVNEVTPGLFAK